MRERKVPRMVYVENSLLNAARVGGMDNFSRVAREALQVYAARAPQVQAQDQARHERAKRYPPL